MSLKDDVDARLRAAGLTARSPEIRQIREHNRQVMEAGWLRVELRRGQFGQTRRVRLRDADPSRR